MHPMIDSIQLQAVSHCTLDCPGCPDGCSEAKPTEFFAQEYASALEAAADHLNVLSLTVSGGEPFLHSDLTGFCHDLTAIFPKPVTLRTNGFWLSEKDVAYFDDLFRTIAGLEVTLHSTVLDRIGSLEDTRALLTLLHERHPHLSITVSTADPLPLSPLSVERHSVERYCGLAGSPRLLPDGRMARCPVQGSLVFAAPGRFYDLHDFDKESFLFWLNRYPLDDCSRCAFSQPEQARTAPSAQPALHDQRIQDYHVATAVKLFHSGQLGSAVEKLFNTLRDYPDCRNAYTDLAQFYQELGYRQKAAQLLEKALDLDPETCSGPSPATPLS